MSLRKPIHHFQHTVCRWCYMLLCLQSLTCTSFEANKIRRHQFILWRFQNDWRHIVQQKWNISIDRRLKFYSLALIKMWGQHHWWKQCACPLTLSQTWSELCRLCPDQLIYTISSQYLTRWQRKVRKTEFQQRAITHVKVRQVQQNSNLICITLRPIHIHQFSSQSLKRQYFLYGKICTCKNL